MKEAMGTSFVFNMIMIFVSVFIFLYVGSIAYSKGFKVRNRIIDIIEKHNGYNSLALPEIDSNLAAIGYQVTNRKCKERDKAVQTITPESSYNYCIYEYETNKGNYYGVMVFIKFAFPLIGESMQIPIYGETRVIFEKDKVEN